MKTKLKSAKYWHMNQGVPLVADFAQRMSAQAFRALTELDISAIQLNALEAAVEIAEKLDPSAHPAQAWSDYCRGRQSVAKELLTQIEELKK